MKWYSDVFDLVFPNLDTAQANGQWKEQLSRKKDDDEVEESGKEDH